MAKEVKNHTQSTQTKDSAVLEEFVQACLALEFTSIEKLCKLHPSIFTTPKTFLKRIKVIFNFFSKNQPSIVLKNSICTGCSKGGLVKQFNATYADQSKNSNFSFLIEYDGPRLKNIRECTQNKFYQDRLWKRMTKGLDAKQIKKMQEGINSLPDF